VNNNPWCYNFDSICNYFNCIASIGVLMTQGMAMWLNVLMGPIANQGVNAGLVPLTEATTTTVLALKRQSGLLHHR